MSCTSGTRAGSRTAPSPPTRFVNTRCRSRTSSSSVGAAMLVVACNSADVRGARRAAGPLRHPGRRRHRAGAARRGCRSRATGRVGVIGTVGTIASGAYQTSGRAPGVGRRAHLRRLSGFRRVRGIRRSRLRSGARARRAAARARPRGEGRHPRPRLHALSVVGPHHRGRDGTRRGPGVERGRDRVRGAYDAGGG